MLSELGEPREWSTNTQNPKGIVVCVALTPKIGEIKLESGSDMP